MTDDELKSILAKITADLAEDTQNFRREMQEDTQNFRREIRQALQEVSEQQKRTDEQLAKTDAQLAKTDAQLAITSAKLDCLGELVGNISNNQGDIGELVGNIRNNQGDIAEEFFYHSFVKKPILGSMRFDSVSRNLNNRIGTLQDEYDIVLTNGDTLAIIEVKAKAHENDLEKLVQKKLPNFSKLFKIYQNYHLYAGVATLVTNPKLINKAQELGLFLLTQQGDHTEIVQTGRLLQ